MFLSNSRYLFNFEQAEKVLAYVYETFVKDEEAYKFITLDEMLTYLRYFTHNDCVFCTVYKSMDIGKYKDGLRLQDSPDTGQLHFKRAKELAIKNPCLMLFQENGTKEGWNGKAFWWPVLVVPKNVPRTIYASKTIGEKTIS